jgi:arsenate reductase (thioredoxin)
MDRPYNMLFISRRNSARSLMAEAVVNRHGNGRFHACSAAFEPAAEVDATTLQMLEQSGYPTEGLRPSSSASLAPLFSTLSSHSATRLRARHFRTGRANRSHRIGVYPDPLKATGDEWQRRREFGQTLAALERQMRVFMQLPLARLDVIALKTHLNEIGIEQAEASDAQTS